MHESGSLQSGVSPAWRHVGESKPAPRALVAGGAGFIGSHLCERLLRQGFEVVCVDNLVTGRMANLHDFERWPGFSFRGFDVVDGLPVGLPRLDRIYHLASPASPPGYQRFPLATMRANSEGTRRLLERAACDGARFLFASTSEAYGDPLEHPQREEYRGNVSTTGPRSMYDEAKRFGEAMTAAFARDGCDARIVRIFNTYGPRSDPDDGRLVPNFFRQALTGEPLTVYGDGSQTRSLCYVDDLVDGLVRAMECPETAGEVINLGNPEEHTVLEFAEMVRVLARSRSALAFTEPAVGDDPQRRRPDITRARELLGWRPHVDLEEGLRRTAAYFEEELGRRACEEVA
jgi:nucleoside-diphosphate-sugar epimerase